VLLIAGAAMAQTGQVELKDAWARATRQGGNGAAYLDDRVAGSGPSRLRIDAGGNRPDCTR